MRRAALLLSLSAFLLGVIHTPPSFAQPTQSVRVGFQILPFQVLSISGSSGAGQHAVSTVQVPQPSQADLRRGAIEQRNAVRLTVRSNNPWRVTVRTNNADMGTSFDRAYIKPIGDFQVRVEGGQYLTIDQRPQELVQGDAGDFSYGVDYKTLFDAIGYRVGNYRIEVVYMVEGR